MTHMIPSLGYKCGFMYSFKLGHDSKNVESRPSLHGNVKVRVVLDGKLEKYKVQVITRLTR